MPTHHYHVTNLRSVHTNHVTNLRSVHTNHVRNVRSVHSNDVPIELYDVYILPNFLSYSYDAVKLLVHVSNDIMWRWLTVSLGCFCLFIIRWLNLVGLTLPFFLLKMCFGRGGFSRCEYLEVLISPKAFNFLETVDVLLCISAPDSLAVVSLPVSSFFLF